MNLLAAAVPRSVLPEGVGFRSVQRCGISARTEDDIVQHARADSHRPRQRVDPSSAHLPSCTAAAARVLGWPCSSLRSVLLIFSGLPRKVVRNSPTSRYLDPPVSIHRDSSIRFPHAVLCSHESISSGPFLCCVLRSDVDGRTPTVGPSVTTPTVILSSDSQSYTICLWPWCASPSRRNRPA